MNDLNKQQFILLIMLVAFVVSVATAISTVTLLEDQPAVIPTTINHIVEKTIEKVTPGGEVKEETEESRISEAVKTNLPSIGTVMIRSWDVASEAKAVTAIGFFIGDGVFVTVADALPERSDFFIKTSDGVLLEAVVTSRSSGVGLLALRDKTKAATLPRVRLAIQTPELGETVLIIGGKEKRAVRKGIISSVDASESGDGAESILLKIYTTANVLAGDSGGVAVNLRGETIGMNIVTKEGSFVIPAQILENLVHSAGSAGGS